MAASDSHVAIFLWGRVMARCGLGGVRCCGDITFVDMSGLTSGNTNIHPSCYAGGPGAGGFGWRPYALRTAGSSTLTRETGLKCNHYLFLPYDLNSKLDVDYHVFNEYIFYA